MKEEINKDMETLKKNQADINNSICQIKFSIKSVPNKVEQVENRVSGTEGKVEELDQIIKDHQKMLRKYKWNMKDIWNTMKIPNLQIMGTEEETQTKGIDNLSNRIIAENSLTLRKRESSGAGSLQNTILSGPKKKLPQTYHNQNTQHTEQRNTESCKREKTSHI
jgi:uncharacterized coiled-coil protein SlyX